MTDLERFELAVRRVHDKHEADHAERGGTLNLDTQKLLKDLMTELATMNRMARDRD